MRALSGFIITAVLLLAVYLPVFGEDGTGRGYYDLGVFAYEDEDYGDAETNLNKALEFEPGNPIYNHYLGKTYLKMGKYEEAQTYLTRAWDIDPGVSGLCYDIAFLHYETGDYAKSSEFFDKVVEEAPENILAHYLGGISHYKNGKYKRALDYFILASDKSPTVKTNGYYYAGICYLKLGDFKKAKEHLEYVRDNAETENLRESSIQWLSSIKELEREHKPWGLTFRLGYIADDNFLREPSLGSIYTDQADNYFGLYFRGYFNFINKNTYKAGVGYEHLETKHDDLDEYDMRVMIPSAYFEYRYSSLEFSLNYFFLNSFIDSDDYLRQHRLRPAVNWKASEKTNILFYVDYDDNDYAWNDGRDGTSMSGRMRGSYVFLKNGNTLYYNLGYLTNSAEHPDYDYSEYEAGLGASFYLPWKLQVGLQGWYYGREHENVDSYYNLLREDDKLIGKAFIARELYFNWLKILFEYSYTDNDSTIEDYTYKKNDYGLALRARF
jgi:Tfp pilus assembly protein PilF